MRRPVAMVRGFDGRRAPVFCQFIVGHDGRRAIFCNQPSFMRSSYCKEHRARVYYKPNPGEL